MANETLANRGEIPPGVQEGLSIGRNMAAVGGHCQPFTASLLAQPTFRESPILES
jgi:hypothetical protein